MNDVVFSILLVVVGLFVGATIVMLYNKFRVSGETYEYAVPLNTILWLQKTSSVKDNTTL